MNDPTAKGVRRRGSHSQTVRRRSEFTLKQIGAPVGDGCDSANNVRRDTPWAWITSAEDLDIEMIVGRRRDVGELLISVRQPADEVEQAVPTGGICALC